VAGDFTCFCQRLFERYSLYSTALHICNSAPCLVLPSLIYRRVDFTVFGAQYPIDQIGDCVLGPIAFSESASVLDYVQHCARRERRILRDPVLLCCASWCQLRWGASQ
jgi:hypothetical protein